MTNEVETLILNKFGKKTNSTYAKQKTYEFYKMIWTYILNSEKFNYNKIEIYFKVRNIGNQYFIDKLNGINFEIKGDYFEFKNLTYFEGCRNEYIDNLLGTNIDINLLIELLESDNIDLYYEVFNDNKCFSVSINIEKNIINNIIDNILIKNKMLRKKL